MHFHRSGIGVALIGVLAGIGLCSIALPALGADKDLDGGTFSVSGLGAAGTAPSKTLTRAIRAPRSLSATGELGSASFQPDGMVARGGAPNDNCEDVPVDILVYGGKFIYTGDNTYATMTCAPGGFQETWHAFDLIEIADVTTSLCGTDPPFGNAYMVIDPECPCSGAFVFATKFDQTTCTDGNWTMHYNALPAGDYWTPVLKDDTSTGPYTWNITAVEVGGPPEICGPDSGDCCTEGGNGSPGCDDEACCEQICEIDKWCCTVWWDDICADEAQDLCDVCQPAECDPPCGEGEICDDGVCVPAPEVPENDTCEDAPVDDLSIAQTLTYMGDNTLATMTCAAGGFEETWHAFDLTEPADVTTSLCGTDPPFGDAYVVLDPECPCSGVFVFATSFDQTTCRQATIGRRFCGLPEASVRTRGTSVPSKWYRFADLGPATAAKKAATARLVAMTRLAAKRSAPSTRSAATFRGTANAPMRLRLRALFAKAAVKVR